MGAVGGNDIFYGGQNVRIYADPGQDIHVQFDRNLNTGTANARFAISGYLVDVTP